MSEPIIGVIGGNEVDVRMAETAYEVGRRIAQSGALLICGGLGGVMEAALRTVMMVLYSITTAPPQ